ncbi:cisplatin damage response ATP-dependent DNA ligase [Alphaproteobacteria bacterium]|nr:cisplatin damage response ATP-dependent DNA ligase [Alphaproteobacteria bacterium]
MKDFSELINKLLLTPSRNRKIQILSDYFSNISDPERGYTLAILTNSLELRNIPISKIKEIIYENVDRDLFALSYDYVGDLAETISLIWPHHKIGVLPSISEIIAILKNIKKDQIKSTLENFLSIANDTERWALIKLISGGLRIGVSSRLTKTALAKFSNKKLNDIESIWHGLESPYENLFQWLCNKADIPKIDLTKTFHPMMLSNPIIDNDFNNLNPNDYVAEWKWDGIRVQIILNKIEVRIFSRTGDDISLSFPEIKNTQDKLIILDGELLVGKDFIPMNFNSLQQRINRKKVSKKHLEEFPAFIKLYDILFLDNIDLRHKPWNIRRTKLKDWFLLNKNQYFDLSEVIDFTEWKKLENIKKFKIIEEEHEGLMIKRKKSPYISGRPKGHWFKWKKEPKTVDAILMYAVRGHGKRSSYYSDFTLGLWQGNEILPICKAYFGFSDLELKTLDKFVRNNTSKKYGPVREVKKTFVIEIAFDSVNYSKRHKSGVALRFPRIKRLREDKPVQEVLQLSQFKDEFLKKSL